MKIVWRKQRRKNFEAEMTCRNPRGSSKEMEKRSLNERMRGEMSYGEGEIINRRRRHIDMMLTEYR